MEKFSQVLKTELLKQDLLQHHFYKLWSAGKLSLDIIREYAIQYYHQVKNFPRYLSTAHSVTEDIQTRKIFLENLCDEENDDASNGIENHVSLWEKFCYGIGVSEDQLKNSYIMSETQNLIDTFYNLSKESTESGLGALYAQEHQYAKISESKKDGLDKFYGVNDREAVKFFSVHEKADIWHAEQFETLLDRVECNKEKIIEAGKKAMAALNGFLDGMVKRFELEEMTC
jgi:pyrroloquinoline-quinone synthase